MKNKIFELEDIKPGLIYWWYPMEYFCIVQSEPYKNNNMYFCKVWFSDDQKIVSIYMNGLINSLNSHKDIRWVK